MLRWAALATAPELFKEIDMTLIVQCDNPAESAPMISFNQCGQMPWSGRHQSVFTGLELVELFEFCEAEGKRQGRNDANQDRIETRQEAPFHQDFMGGYPKRLWEQAYWEGVSEFGNLTQEEIDLELQEVLADPSTTHWLRQALTSAIPRDPVDALNDAEYLSDVLMRRCSAMANADAEPMTLNDLPQENDDGYSL